MGFCLFSKPIFLKTEFLDIWFPQRCTTDSVVSFQYISQNPYYRFYTETCSKNAISPILAFMAIFRSDNWMIQRYSVHAAFKIGSLGPKLQYQSLRIRLLYFHSKISKIRFAWFSNEPNFPRESSSVTVWEKLSVGLSIC